MGLCRQIRSGAAAVGGAGVMEMDGFLQLIQTGGNTAMMAVAYALWRFDRRLYSLEQWIERHQPEVKK